MRVATVALLLALATDAASLELEGDAIQGALMRGRAPGCAVALDGTPIKVATDGGFVIGFGRDHPPQAVVEATCPDGKTRQRLSITERRYEEQRLELPEAMVTFDEATLARIRAEAARVEAARETDSGLLAHRAPLLWPVVGTITGVYGSRRILNGEPRQPHYGIDIEAPAGAPVRAAAAGIVTFAADLYLSGGTVIIDHGHGVSTSYLHLAEIAVAPGEAVAQGQPIATVGASGRATGAHLDWRLNWYQTRLDPALVAGPMPEK